MKLKLFDPNPNPKIVIIIIIHLKQPAEKLALIHHLLLMNKERRYI